MSLPAGLKPPRAVLFDWDNTLVNTWPTIVECYHDTFHALGQTPWTADEVRERAHGSCATCSRLVRGARATKRAGVLRDLLPHPSGAAGAAARRRRAAGALSQSRLLRRRGQQQGWGQSARRAGASRLGPVDIPGGRRQGRQRDKPAPDPIFMALDGTGIAPDETVWMVGDTPADLKCAHAAGCLPVLVGRRGSCPGATGVSTASART